MPIYVKKSGVYTAATAVYVKKSGSYVPMTSMYTKISGAYAAIRTTIVLGGNFTTQRATSGNLIFA